MRRNAPRNNLSQFLPRPAMKPVNPDDVDPKTILATIAADPAQPAGARVAAAKALLSLNTVMSGGTVNPNIDRISRKALELLAHGRAN